MKALVIGSGSLGERHAKNLASYFESDVSVLSRNTNKFRSEYLNTSDRVHKVCFDSLRPSDWDVCVIATPSSIRTESLSKLDNHQLKSLYVEVPVATTKENWLKLKTTADKHKAHIHAGYNMRYHKSWKYIYELSTTSTFRSINSIFAEHLPSLHTWENYKTRYEAVRGLGGGPLLTSHHELDMAINLLGRVKQVSCCEHNTNLDIDSPDHALITLIHESGSLSTIDLNFFYPRYTRISHIATDNDVI